MIRCLFLVTVFLLLAACTTPAVLSGDAIRGPQYTQQPAVQTQGAMNATAAARRQPSTSTSRPTGTATTVLATTVSSGPGHTATPQDELGPSVTVDKWRLTVEGAREETSLSAGIAGISETSYTPVEGYTFLVVDVEISGLDLAEEVRFKSADFAVVDAGGQIRAAVGGGNTSASGLCADCEVEYQLLQGSSLSVTIVFAVEKDLIDRPWQLLHQDWPAIPFSVGE